MMNTKRFVKSFLDSIGVMVMDELEEEDLQYMCKEFAKTHLREFVGKLDETDTLSSDTLIMVNNKLKNYIEENLK